MHHEHSNTRLETPAYGRGENSVRAMKEMVKRQKESINTLGVVFSTEHHLFAMLVRNDFLVEVDNPVVKTSPYESHTGKPAPR